MGDKTGIAWTDATWNPATGCTPLSAGCDACYARVLAERLQRMGNPKYAHGFTYTEHPSALTLPIRWRAPRRIFVNSMSDLFHEDATLTFVTQVFGVMLDTPRHTYQVLTKRPGKAAGWVRAALQVRGLPALPPHIWIGTSVEDQRVDYRIGQLLRVPAAVRFLSCEPLIGPLDLAPWLSRPDGLAWVIAGGESGPQHRPLHLAWARALRDQCQAAGIPYFFKQVGGRTPNAGGHLLDGQAWQEFPTPRAAGA